MARSAGSERRLRGGSGPRPDYVWCAGALVIPGAQRSQNAGPLVSDGPAVSEMTCFGGVAVAHDRRAVTSGWSMVPEPFIFKGPRNPQFKRSWRSSRVAPRHVGIASAQFTKGSTPSPFTLVRRCPCSMVVLDLAASLLHT